MSTLSIAFYFPLHRVKVSRQSVSIQDGMALIDIEPDQRFTPVCHECGAQAGSVHSHQVRAVSALDFPSVHVCLRLAYRKVLCPRCRRIVAVDEIAVKKGHRYMTVVIDYETGRVVWMGKERTKESLAEFFAGMTEEQKARLEAVAMDMGQPHIQAVREAAPEAEIVFDLYHAVAAYNKDRRIGYALVIDRVRMEEYRKASTKDKAVFKGARYLLLRRRLERPEHREHLRKLLLLNETLFFAYILRDKLALIWRYRYRAWARRALIFQPGVYPQ